MRTNIIFYNISLVSSKNETCLRQNFNEYPTIFYVKYLFFFENRAIHELVWKNIVEPGRPQMTIWFMRIACWLPKATDPHTTSQYVILITFPLQQRLYECALMLRYTYNAPLIYAKPLRKINCGNCFLDKPLDPFLINKVWQLQV